MSINSVLTTKCSTYQHPEFRLVFDTAIPQADIDVLASFLHESVKGGVQYKDGDLITIGSMLLRVARTSDYLTLEEPDLQSVPIEWTQGVTRSMKLLRLQKDIAESVGLGDELDHPAIRCSILVGADLTQQDNELVLERIRTADCDSGWFVGRRDTDIYYDEVASLTRISVYQAILNWPQIGGFLALPAGCRIDLSGTTSRVARNGRPLEIKSGSLIDVLASTLKGDNP